MERLKASATVAVLKIVGFLVLVADAIMVIYIIDRAPGIKDNAERILGAILEFGAPAAIVGTLLIVGAFVLDAVAGVADAVIEGAEADEDDGPRGVR